MYMQVLAVLTQTDTLFLPLILECYLSHTFHTQLDILGILSHGAAERTQQVNRSL